MRAYLHAVTGPSWSPLDEFQPDDPERFGLSVQALMGPAPEGGADSFDFLVCSPRWFADAYDHADLRRSAEVRAPLTGANTERELMGAPRFRPVAEPDPVLFGYGLVFMQRWDAVALEAAIRELCERTEGPTWGAVASRLHRLLPWEFVYRYDQAVDDGRPFPAEDK